MIPKLNLHTSEHQHNNLARCTPRHFAPRTRNRGPVEACDPGAIKKRARCPAECSTAVAVANGESFLGAPDRVSEQLAAVAAATAAQKALDEANIEIPFPHRKVIVVNESA